MKPRLQGGHRLRLLQNGAELFPAMVAAIDRAQHLVHLETYIFEFAGDALQVAWALERAACRGVAVRVVLDGVGTARVPKAWVDRWRNAGVQWHRYAPMGVVGLLIPSRWRRLHRKLCVVDGAVGFCGGINLIDDLDDLALGRLSEPRLDYALEAQGPLVHDMLAAMALLWWRTQAMQRARRREFRSAWSAWRSLLPAAEAWPPSESLDPGVEAALLLRDNLLHRHDIERAYLKAIGEARQDIVIANAYFIPGRRLRRALILAAQRGVRVRLLSQGKYEHFLQYHAARPVYARLLRFGIEIHEYAPSALHAKVAVVDQRWATVGSTNLDPLSLLLAREANVVTTDPAFAQDLQQRLDTLLRTSGDPVSLDQLRRRSWRLRALDRLAFGLMRLVLFLTGHRY